jgi:hypothetical protein
MEQLNKDRSFQDLSKSRFDRIPQSLLQKLDCDLYEINDELWAEIELMVNHRDSLLRADSLLMQTDSLAADSLIVPDETFLEQLYKRKLRIRARQLQDSTRMAEIKIEEEGD